MNTELQRQQQLIQAMCAPGFFAEDCQVAETHISWVLLTGCDAYKIKKSIKLDFLDFSTLERRHFFCIEELRLTGMANCHP